MKCCSGLRSSLARIEASQSDNLSWIFRSAKQLSVTSSEILGIRRCVCVCVCVCARARVRVMDSSEHQNRTQNREEGKFFWVLGKLWSWEKDRLIPRCYNRWNLGPSFWTGVKRQTFEWHHPQPARQKISLHEWARSSSLPSEPVKDRFCWTRCREGRQSSPKPTSGRWRNSRSVTKELDLTNIQQNSSLSMKMQGRTQVWNYGKPS